MDHSLRGLAGVARAQHPAGGGAAAGDGEGREHDSLGVDAGEIGVRYWPDLVSDSTFAVRESSCPFNLSSGFAARYA